MNYIAGFKYLKSWSIGLLLILLPALVIIEAGDSFFGIRCVSANKTAGRFGSNNEIYG